MSLLSDLITGKEIPMASGGKLTIAYKEDANVLAINGVVLTTSEVQNLQIILSILAQSKRLESKV